MERSAIEPYEAAKQALAKVQEIDEAKDFRDRAEALEIYARRAKDDELVKRATAIRLYAERRAGELLRAMDKNRGAQGIGKVPSSPNEHTPPKLADIGITHDESSLWQRLATVPEPDFEQLIEQTNLDTNRLTARRVVAIASEPMPAKPRLREADGLPLWFRSVESALETISRAVEHADWSVIALRDREPIKRRLCELAAWSEGL